MKKCSVDGCHEVCDFCVFYRDDGGFDMERFEGEGDCIHYGKRVDAGDGQFCQEFRCINYGGSERL